LPVKLRLMEVLSKLIGLFLKLSPRVQRIIVMCISLAAAAAVVVGIIVALAGVFLIMSAAATAAGTSLGALLATAGIYGVSFSSS